MALYPMPSLPSDDKRWKVVNSAMRKNGFARHALIETLHQVQSSFGYLDDVSIRFVARSLRVPLSQAYGVATFYHYFSLKPPGKHTMTVCAGTACYIKGSGALLEAAEKHLGILAGETTKDQLIGLVKARCVGACSRAPVVIADGEVAGEMSAEQMIAQLETWVMVEAGAAQ
jgi:bidirectional [NiFe] hydrogenase diaphorase subunit